MNIPNSKGIKMEAKGTKTEQPSGTLVRTVGKGTKVCDVAFDLGDWAKSLSPDLENRTVHTVIMRNGYDVLLTDRGDMRKQSISIAHVQRKGTDGVQIVFDQTNEYGRRCAQEEYEPFSQH